VFSPDGTQFACATTEGLLVYSLSHDLLSRKAFNPIEIDENVTLDNIISQLKEENYLMALVFSLRLGEREVTDKVFKCIPISAAEIISSQFPSNYLFSFLDFLRQELENSRDIEWNLIWLK
jgi:periodic tryptophan protein 2